MNRKRYSGTTMEEMSRAISTYFPPGSREYETVMSDWRGWINWRPGKRRMKSDEEGKRVPQEQPGYTQSFTLAINHDTADIRFRKGIIFRGELKKSWDQRRHGILKNTAGYQLTV